MLEATLITSKRPYKFMYNYIYFYILGWVRSQNDYGYIKSLGKLYPPVLNLAATSMSDQSLKRAILAVND